MLTNTAQLTAHELELLKVFSSDFDFRIPEYQRPYSWRPEHALQLLDDLGEALEQSEDEPYFLGSVVLVKRPESADSDVIDGQQRLTTLTILLSVLRDLSTEDEVRAELAIMVREPGSKVQGLEAKPRLALRERDADFFKEFVQEPGGTTKLLGINENHLTHDSLRSIVDNTRSLTTMLKSDKWPEDRRFRLIQLLSKRTLLVVVTTSDLDSAYRIFSVMNARGLDLSPSDIFKSQVVGALSDADRKTYADKWEDIEAALGRQDFGDLFAHVRMIYAKQRAQADILKEFPKQVLNTYTNSGRAAEFVDDVLVPYADAYQQLRGASFTAASGADTVNDWLRRLNRVGNTDWRPVALWALRAKWDDPSWLASFLQQLERIAASMLLRRVYATPRALKYAEILRDVDEKGLGLSAPSLQLSASEIKATRAALDGDVYLHTQGRRFILLRVDEVLANSPGVTYDNKVITVEHVLPQNPASKSKWHKSFSDDERSEWTHRLANLVLLNRTKNSEAQNYDFDVKKAKYFVGKKGVSTFALTSQVLSADKWNPRTLEGRQKSLLSAIFEEWGLGAV
ncbi:DUF262 domain-containing protein [Gordonia sp. Z-3]|uniref:DUF262 domain-containing protein n=1 Tax=Gordonia sp. Z-3 TaxID=3115408 RepID=UPI002E2B9071|nr:DUF262 domain-containing protein [Gordonia sp. Z-3]MED5801239.1 DUF262 domain-containing protein [Gordonia sp. Z-3]